MLKALKSLPISVKLIGTTTLLLLFTVGLYGVMNVQDLSKVYDESRQDQQRMILEATTIDARNVTSALAQIAAIQIAATAFGDLEAVIKEMMNVDSRLVFVTVREGEETVVQAGDEAAATAGITKDESLTSRAKGSVLDVYRKGDDPVLIRSIVDFSTGEGGIQGTVEAGWSITAIAAQNAAIAERVDARRRVSLLNTVFVGALVVLLGLVLTILQSLRISRPLRELTDSVERIAHGDLSERALVDSGDEIGVLSRNFNYMAERLGVLLTETKEKATLEKELEVARIIQESLLPPSRLIEREFIEFMGYFKSASICGGDWWSYSELAGGRLLMLIGDVTGHGVSSAMITAAAKSCCDTLRHVTDGELTVTFLLEELNKTIYEAANRKFVMTFFATIIDPRTRTITFSNAGHNFPLLFRANPGQGEPAVVPLVDRGNRLGDVMESRFTEKQVRYDVGDVLVWYTDGITEGVGNSGEEYGDKRFRRSIRSVLDQGADHILDRILKDAAAWFANFQQPEDDITLVVGKFR
jgi:serine phosphatase RsbU (regulator of sigma subunit)